MVEKGKKGLGLLILLLVLLGLNNVIALQFVLFGGVDISSFSNQMIQGEHSQQEASEGATFGLPFRTTSGDNSLDTGAAVDNLDVSDSFDSFYDDSDFWGFFGGGDDDAGTDDGGNGEGDEGGTGGETDDGSGNSADDGSDDGSGGDSGSGDGGDSGDGSGDGGSEDDGGDDGGDDDPDGIDVPPNDDGPPADEVDGDLTFNFDIGFG
ncbi:MAG: hypothetical protein ABIH92_02880 [Nanoarchaeota archaeon]